MTELDTSDERTAAAHTEGKAATARRVMLARYSGADPANGAGSGEGGGEGGGADPTVHLLPLPLREHRDGSAAVAYCGVRIPAERIEAVQPERSAGRAWCVLCFTAHTTGAPPAPAPGAAPFSTPTTAGRAQAAQEYVSYGWPIRISGDQVRLDLSRGGVAVAIPALLAADITDVLAARRCAPTVLAHPAIPSHRIVLSGERYVVPLGWPGNIHRITTSLPLPPTVTSSGPVVWTRAPEPHSLALCREIDILTALRAVLARRFSETRESGKRRRADSISVENGPRHVTE